MPITVQYGATEASNAGQILAQSGLANLAREQQSRLEANRLGQQSRLEADRLRQQRDMQLTQIDAQANQQRYAAEMNMASNAMRFGLNQQLQEDEYIREVETNKQKAKQEAEQFDYIYTQKQRQELAQNNDALRRAESSGEFSEKELVKIRRAMLLKNAGVNPTAVPADSNKKKYPEGRGINDVWTDEDGNMMRRDPDGRPDVIVDRKDTREGQQEQWDHDKQQEERKWISGLSTELVDDGEGGKRPREGEEIAGVIFTAENAKEELDRMRAEKQRQQEQQQQELIESSARIFGMGGQQQPDPVAEEQAGFIGLAEQLGIQPNEKEQRLPGDVGAMFAILRTVDERYTDKDGKLDLSKAPPELIQNLEIMEQRAASWLAGEQLDRNRKPIPKKKGFKRSKVGGFMGGTMVGQF